MHLQIASATCGPSGIIIKDYNSRNVIFMFTFISLQHVLSEFAPDSQMFSL